MLTGARVRQRRRHSRICAHRDRLASSPRAAVVNATVALDLLLVYPTVAVKGLAYLRGDHRNVLRPHGLPAVGHRSLLHGPRRNAKSQELKTLEERIDIDSFDALQDEHVILLRNESQVSTRARESGALRARAALNVFFRLAISSYGRGGAPGRVRSTRTRC